LQLVLLSLFLWAFAPVSPAPPSFDQPIDPEICLILPGDTLSVIFIGTGIQAQNYIVDAQGRVVDENLGVIDLSQATLAQARGLLSGRLEKSFQASDFEISIKNLHPVSITITGAVEHPGSYRAYNSERVSDIIKAAGGLTDNASRRMIKFRGGPKELTVDLDRAFFAGDRASDPPLYAGDRVIVPYRSEDRVNVIGEVNRPVSLEFIAGDDLDRLLELAGGLTDNADKQAITITAPDNRVVDQPVAGAVIKVPARIAAGTRLILFGAVNQPGTFAYQKNVTLGDILKNGGGFADNANHERVVVFREGNTDELGRRIGNRYPIIINPQQYQTQTLFPGDSIFVPVQTGFVRVSGYVKNPGYFPYQSNKTAAYYIDLAGGFLAEADRELIGRTERISGITVKASTGILIFDGDEVVVEMRKELP
jgi:protein involved in polysaccharide export with SLBB domain